MEYMQYIYIGQTILWHNYIASYIFYFISLIVSYIFYVATYFNFKFKSL